MTDLRLVVFDVDGTLVDSQGVIVTAMRAAFEAAGHPAPEPAAIRAIIGLSLPVAVAALIPALPSEVHTEIVARYRGALIADRAAGGAEAAVPLFPGAREALDALRAAPDTLLGVATGKGRHGLDHLLATHGLAEHFVTLQSADGHPSKPHPSMLLAALAETGSATGRAVMVGDTEFDIAMGLAAGYATVAVSWGYHSVDRLRRAGADLVIDDFEALGPALEALREQA